MITAAIWIATYAGHHVYVPDWVALVIGIFAFGAIFR